MSHPVYTALELRKSIRLLPLWSEHKLRLFGRCYADDPNFDCRFSEEQLRRALGQLLADDLADRSSSSLHWL